MPENGLRVYGVHPDRGRDRIPPKVADVPGMRQAPWISENAEGRGKAMTPEQVEGPVVVNADGMPINRDELQKMLNAAYRRGNKAAHEARRVVPEILPTEMRDIANSLTPAEMRDQNRYAIVFCTKINAWFRERLQTIPANRVLKDGEGALCKEIADLSLEIRATEEAGYPNDTHRYVQANDRRHEALAELAELRAQAKEAER